MPRLGCPPFVATLVVAALAPGGFTGIDESKLTAGTDAAANGCTGAQTSVRLCDDFGGTDPAALWGGSIVDPPGKGAVTSDEGTLLVQTQPVSSGAARAYLYKTMGTA